MVISDELWRGTFASDPSIVGKQIILDETPCTVIGVMPAGFTGTEPAASAFWAPVTMQKTLDAGRDRLGDSNMSWLAVLGRVRPGVTLEQVRADLSVIAARIDASHPGRQTTLAIARAAFFGRPNAAYPLLPAASIVLAAFGLVLPDCVRQREQSFAGARFGPPQGNRPAANHGRQPVATVRQLLTESVCSRTVGGTLGSLFAFWSFAAILRVVTSQLSKSFPTLALNVTPDFRVLGFAMGLTLITGIVFGLVPALRASSLDLNTALKDDGTHAVLGKRSGRFFATHSW